MIFGFLVSMDFPNVSTTFSTMRRLQCILDLTKHEAGHCGNDSSDIIMKSKAVIGHVEVKWPGLCMKQLVARK